MEHFLDMILVGWTKAETSSLLIFISEYSRPELQIWFEMFDMKRRTEVE